MPYISARDQERFDSLVKEIDVADIQTPGELNFLLTKLAVRYLEVNGSRYQQMNDVMGALTGAQAEFYRRVAAPYETQKAFDVDQEGKDPYNKQPGRTA